MTNVDWSGREIVNIVWGLNNKHRLCPELMGWGGGGWLARKQNPAGKITVYT